jgi:DNA-binding response OmpR family regulator
MPKIFIADDDAGIMDALQIMLKDAGYEVSVAADNDIVTHIVTEQPDLVLLDIWMEGIDGRDICKQLKADKNTKVIPVVIISANRETGKIAKEAGADDFLAKPFDMIDLLQMAAKYTAKPKAASTS